ncbi:hypothetical protein M0804_000842 [Polistes exclamans]|nr:hypothetical protein M0804_000842 [Polistes exclamans]
MDDKPIVASTTGHLESHKAVSASSGTHENNETRSRRQSAVSKSEAELYDLFTSQWAMGAGCIAIAPLDGRRFGTRFGTPPPPPIPPPSSLPPLPLPPHPLPLPLPLSPPVSTNTNNTTNNTTTITARSSNGVS